MNNRFSVMDENNGEGRMEKVTLSEATREKVEEATLSVFMEQYGAAMDAGVEIKMAECADMEFPPELDKRIQKLIATEQAKKRNKQRRKTALRVLRSAAAVIMILLSVSSILFMTVEAFRVPVMNFFIEKTDRYWQLSDAPSTSSIPKVFNPENPLEDILPIDFSLAHVEGSWETNCLSANYSNGKGAEITLLVISADTIAQIDCEDSNVSNIKLAEHDAIVSVEGNVVRVSWLIDDVSRAFTLCATNISEGTVILFAEEFSSFFA